MYNFINIIISLLLVSNCSGLENGESVEFYVSAVNITGLPGGTGGFFYRFQEGALNHNPPQTIWFDRNFTFSEIVTNSNPVWGDEIHRITKVNVPYVVYGTYRLQFYEKMENGRNESISGFWQETTSLPDWVETSCQTSNPYEFRFRSNFTCYLHCIKGPGLTTETTEADTDTTTSSTLKISSEARFISTAFMVVYYYMGATRL